MEKKTGQDEVQLMEPFRNGDDKALAYFFDLHYKSLCYFAVRLTQDNEQAEDIVSECFLKLWRNRTEFQTTQNIKAFLYISCRNACLNYLKYLKRRNAAQELYFGQLQEGEDTILYQIIETEVLGILSKEIEELPEHPFSDELLTVKNILNDPRLQWMTVESSISQLSLQKTARYDHLLRHTMQTPLTTVLEIFYQLDVYIAVGSLAQEKGFSYARALPAGNNLFKAVELSHPGIPKAVANPVSFTQESNMIFLTGANMAGKSTFMKAFGINVYLAHMGFPVAAKEMQFSVKEGIYSSINVPDNLDMGYSHFYAEVLRVKKVAGEVSKEKNLVIIFDELFKGTNVKDAYDATLAVTAAFSEYRNCLFIISTHIIEAGEVLQKEQDNIQMSYLPTIMNGTIPVYTYRLQPGISSDRHGMIIIENEGILDIIQSELPV